VPTVARFAGFRVMIYTNDHEPKHVHVYHGGDLLIVEIETAALRKNFGVSTRLENQAIKWVNDNRAFLTDEWIRIHGGE